MKKILFIDRDGTLVIEPPVDYQLDSLEKLEFYPAVFRWLGEIARKLDFKLVIVTNQDGLGTNSFPEDSYWPPQNKMIEAFKNEGIEFSEVIVDKTFPSDNAPTRKPGTGLLQKYIDGDYDLANSFVIGDRITDVELAKNLGSKAIWINHEDDKGLEEIAGKVEELKDSIALETTKWEDIYTFLAAGERTASVQRDTKETKIAIHINLDGEGVGEMNTGLPFFDHMLDQIAKHSGIDLSIQVTGDLHIDEHHTIEDTALALGEAFKIALGNKLGIDRYGYCLPMDDCLAQVALDFGGRPWLVWDAEFNREKVGDMPTEMFEHFFKSFSDTALCNLNIKAEGKNEHHKIEGIFKALARAIKVAVRRDSYHLILPSTKGAL
ncbi:MAG: imidazoleglycerol-phosphate dehydratase/histidinol-phosphatase [Saprospiraceae bacterium]|jgi:imidazoleglycerol-phosphate dehydratase/histidinol-phosphatase